MQRTQITKRTVMQIKMEMMRNIPVYPKEIQHVELSRKVHIPEILLGKYMLNLSEDYLVCEREGRWYCFENQEKKDQTLRRCRRDYRRLTE